MNTGPSNGNGVNGANVLAPPPQQQVQVNPIQAAQYALTFLSRATFNRQERQAFDIAEAMLTAIANGQVSLAQPTTPESADPAPPL